MFRNYILVNILLLIVIGFLGLKFYGILSHSVDIPTLDSVNASREDRVVFAGKERRLDQASIQVIVLKDIFRPSRTSSLSAMKSREPVDFKNLPVLFGTIIMDGKKKAIIKDPEDKVTKTFDTNDLVAGFLISEILEDKVILVRDGEKIELKLRSKKSIKSKPSARTKASTRKRRVRPQPKSKTNGLMHKLSGMKAPSKSSEKK